MPQLKEYWVWVVPIIATIICTVVLIYFFLDYSTSAAQCVGQGRNLNLLYTILILIIIILVVLFPVSYYYISSNLKKEIQNNLQIISQIASKNNEEKQKNCPNITKTCKTFVLKFLNYNENRVIKKLIENKGEILQSEISRLPNMGKVKAHRVLKDMQIKGIINIENYGKTNKIFFSDDAKQVFLM